MLAVDLVTKMIPIFESNYLQMLIVWSSAMPNLICCFCRRKTSACKHFLIYAAAAIASVQNCFRTASCLSIDRTMFSSVRFILSAMPFCCEVYAKDRCANITFLPEKVEKKLLTNSLSTCDWNNLNFFWYFVILDISTFGRRLGPWTWH